MEVPGLEKKLWRRAHCIWRGPETQGWGQLSANIGSLCILCYLKVGEVTGKQGNLFWYLATTRS